MLKEGRYIFNGTWLIRSCFILKSYFGRPFYIHFHIGPQLYISQIKTNCRFIRRLIGRQITPLIFYRILDLEKHPSLPQLSYYLLYKFRHRDVPVYLNLGKYLLHTCGRLKVEKEKYILELQLYRILSSSRENYLEIAPYHKHLSHKLYQHLVDEVSMKNLNIDDFLSMQPSSRSNLFRVFKKVVGVSPNTVRRDYRIFQFQKRLLETDHSIHRLFLESGFKSRAHLYGLFQEIYGMSPKMFRKIYRDKVRTIK